MMKRGTVVSHKSDTRTQWVVIDEPVGGRLSCRAVVRVLDLRGNIATDVLVYDFWPEELTEFAI